MSFYDKYNDWHVWGVQFIRIEAHAGLGFFFPTVAGIWGLTPLLWVFGLMLGVIGIKEALDDKTTDGPYSLVDLCSWLVGGGLAIGFYFLRGWV